MGMEVHGGSHEAIGQRDRHTPSLNPLISLNTGCDEEILQEFRSAASDSMAEGLKTMLDGIVDGVFEVIEPDEDSDGSCGS